MSLDFESCWERGREEKLGQDRGRVYVTSSSNCP